MESDLVRNLIAHYSEQEVWLRKQAATYEAGRARHLSDGRDDSAAVAEEFLHRANNMAAVIAAYRRLTSST